MVQVDPLAELLDSKVINGGLASILGVPDPPGAVKTEYPDDTIIRVFALLGAVVHRDPRLRGSANEDTLPAESPEWAEAYCKIVTFVVWLLNDDRIRDRLAAAREGGPLGVQFMRFVGSPKERGLTGILVLERGLVFSFIMGSDTQRALFKIPYD